MAAAHAAFPAWAAMPPVRTTAAVPEGSGHRRSPARRCGTYDGDRGWCKQGVLILPGPSVLGDVAAGRELGIPALRRRHAQRRAGAYCHSWFASPWAWSRALRLGTARSISLGARFLLPMAFGNTTVIKPSEVAPMSAGLMHAEILEEAGFPAGTFNVVTHAPGEAAAIADVFFESPAVRCINFTGSDKTARILADGPGAHSSAWCSNWADSIP